MDDLDQFRLRLSLAGASIPEELVPMVHLMFGPMLDASRALLARDMADTMPFVAGQRLIADGVG